MDSQRFDLPVAAVLRLQSRSGKIRVVAEPRDDVLVEGDGFSAEDDAGPGAALCVRSGRGGSKSLEVRCPAGTDIVAGTHSGAVEMTGDFGSVSVTTMSGAIDVDTVDEADLRSGSAGITLKKCRDRCRMNSVSGSIKGGETESAAAGTMSGSISVARVGRRFKARTVSGNIEATCDGDAEVTVKTISGKVQIRMPEGTRLATRIKTLSGRVRNEFPPGNDAHLQAMTVSGTIELVPS